MTEEFILRILISALLGGAIGLEREYRAKEAGFRTHFLVALGSALFMIVSAYGFGDAVYNELHRWDVSRVAAQVVSGIGFIGAGTIIFQKHIVRGLTTAAGLWVTAAIGLTCGGGMYLLAAAATVLVLLCLEAMNYVLHRFGAKNILLTFLAPTSAQVQEVVKQMRRDGIRITSYDLKEHHGQYEVNMELQVMRKSYNDQIVELMDRLDGMVIERIE